MTSSVRTTAPASEYSIERTGSDVVATAYAGDEAADTVTVGSDGKYVLRLPESLQAVADWGEQNPFLPLLLGFTLFYGLERGFERPVDHGSSHGAERPVHFWVHMLGMSLYKILLGYLMGQVTSVSGLISFAFAMTMHFLVIDFHLLEMHRSAYHRIGRWILTGAFLVGWILSTQVEIATAVLAMLGTAARVGDI